MRSKFFVWIVLALAFSLALFAGGCGKKGSTAEQTRFNTAKKNVAKQAAPVKFQTSKATSAAGLVDLLGLQPNRRWVYTGTGDKAANYEVDLTFSNGTLYQLEEYRQNAVTAHVIELRADGAYEILVQPGAKSRTNLLTSQAVTGRDKTKDVKLVPWPVRKGTSWTLPNGAKSTVVNTTSVRTVPFGKQSKVVLVRTEPGGPLPGTTASGTPGSTKQSPQSGGSTLVAKRVDTYYAPRTGLIETRYSVGKASVVSRLSRVTTVLTGTATRTNMTPGANTGTKPRSPAIPRTAVPRTSAPKAATP